MKKTILFIVAIFFASQIKAQVNLVPNPSFEDTIGCNTPKYWTSFGYSPDYYNSCENGSWLDVPFYGGGYQYAANGNAYFGLYTYGIGFSNLREYIGSPLIQTLIPNTKYFVSFKVNLADFANCATDKMGVLFSTKAYNDTVIAPINNHPKIFSTSIISDTSNWVKISGSFIADSAYQYIIIGNFFDDTHTNSSILVAGGNTAYYLVDDICVSSDSSLCKVDLASQSVMNNNEEIFCPSIVNTTILIRITNQRLPLKCIMYNSIGQRLKYYTVNSEIELNINDLPNGLYYLQFQNNLTSVTKKIIINH